MKLHNLGGLFGISAEDLKKANKKYKFLVALTFVIDIGTICALTVLLYNAEAKVEYYGYALVAICLVTTFVIQFKLNKPIYDIASLFRRYRNRDVTEHWIKVDGDNINQLLFDVGAKPVADTKFSEFKDSIYNFCKANIKNTGKVASAFGKVEDAKDGNAKYLTFKCWTKPVFVGFLVDNE